MAAMQSLQDFLKGIQNDPKQQEILAKARDGVQGAWDGPPMPLNQEYRVTIDKAEYKASGSGKMQFAITFEVTEPAEQAGRKLQDYFSPDASNVWGHQKFTQMIGAFAPDLTNVGNDWATLADRFNGTSAVVALRQWGEQNDRYGIRYANGDRGQTLSTTVKPPKTQGAGGTAKPLRPEISISKPEPAQATEATATDQPAADSAPAPAPAQLPGGQRPAGSPNLPPGLR